MRNETPFFGLSKDEPNGDTNKIEDFWYINWAEYLESSHRFILLDIRETHSEFSIRISITVQVPFTELHSFNLKTGIGYVMLCEDGEKSKEAWFVLRKKGYFVYILKGGYSTFAAFLNNECKL